MPIDRYCTNQGCPGGDGCTNSHRTKGESCTMEYIADPNDPTYNWHGDEPPPRRWRAKDGTIVYRSFSDYCD